MCCTVETSSVQRFVGLLKDETLAETITIMRDSVPKHSKQNCQRLQMSRDSHRNAPPTKKVEENNNEIKLSPSDCEEETMKVRGKKKRKKWTVLPLCESGFVLSLFPRQSVSDTMSKEEEELLARVEDEVAVEEDRLEQFAKYHMASQLMERQKTGTDLLLRPDRDRKIRKAGKQVKDKYCSDVSNNKGRKKLFIHHRLSKIINLEVHRLSYLPSGKSKWKQVDISVKNMSNDSNRSRLKPAAAQRSTPAQNLNHALHSSNAPSDLSSDIVSVLVSLQHRELTPEDYDLLLRLDESVAPKTLDRNTVAMFHTDIVKESSVGEVCPVCMEMYEVGQERMYLPCNHVFHSPCIERWLENSSQNCPIDGLPVNS